ncbi:MAG TPA: class I SAM-dependent methyltransferase [Isosphaeraceae bacterium]|jgi:SAM-dependent methyltransferase|nr:class I SAM-dependent methyltransferase [Isosphaeraceae bacterium]
MPRDLDRRTFDRVFDEVVVRGRFNEVPEYYPRYRSRYRALMKLYAEVAGPPPIDFLDIGGGQYAAMAATLWGDRATLADVGGSNGDYLRERGVRPVEWNLCGDAEPFDAEFDVAMFSEVIEHLPIPGHIVLERLRRALRPGGTLICTTPNLYRLRNVVYMAIGKRMFDHFRMPTDRGLGHILEYTRDHLRWQFERAGFEDVGVELRQFPHNPNALHFRVLSWLGAPLYLVPRFREALVVVARAPAGPAAPRPTSAAAEAGKP